MLELPTHYQELSGSQLIETSVNNYLNFKKEETGGGKMTQG